MRHDVEFSGAVFRVRWYRLFPWLMGGMAGLLSGRLAGRSVLNRGGAFIVKRVPPMQRNSNEAIPASGHVIH